MPAVRPEAIATQIALRKKAGGLSDPCSICQTRVARQSDLKRHMKTHDSYENKSFRCPYCNYRSSLKDAFVAHLGKHEGIIQYCKEAGCGAQYKDKASLSRHHTKVHKNEQEKNRLKRAQLVQTVRKTLASATARREVVGDVNKAYPQFFSAPQPPFFSNADSPSSLSTSTELSDSDQEFSPMPPTPPFATSPQYDMAAYHLLNKGQYISPELVEKFNLASDSSETYAFKREGAMTSASLLHDDASTTSSWQHPNYALTGFYDSAPKEPYISMALQDFSYDTPTELDYFYPTSQALGMGLIDNTPVIQDGYASSNVGLSPMAGNGLYDFFQHQESLTVDGLFSFQPQTTESSLTSGSSPGNNYQTTECADLMDSFQSYTQASGDSNLIHDPLQYQDFSWFTEVPVPGHLF